MQITFRHDLNAAIQNMQRISQGNLSHPMAAISIMLQTSVEENFRAGGRYDRAGSIFGGTNKWKVTNNPTPLIKKGMAGGLMGTFAHGSNQSAAWVSNNKPYAAAHNFGVDMGARSNLLTRSTARRMNLPARPFLVIQEEDLEDAQEIIETWAFGGNP